MWFYVCVCVGECVCCLMRSCVFVRGVLYGVVWIGVFFVLSACDLCLSCVRVACDA